VNVLVYLVPLALALGLTGLAAFLWSLCNGQYDDMEGASLRVLADDDVTPPPRETDGFAGDGDSSPLPSNARAG